MKNRSLQKILSGVLVAGLMVSCMGMEESDPSSLQMPEVKTFEVKDNASLVFELTASVDKSLSGRIAECGFYYGKDKSMSGAEKVECKMLGGTFSADITLHEYGETFYACSYISNGVEGNEICSDPKSITVKELQDYVEFSAPVLISYDKSSAKVSVNYKAADGVEATESGACFGKTESLSIDNGSVKAVDGVAELLDLETGESYYVCSYVKDGDDVAYSRSVPFAVYGMPVVVTVSAPHTDSESALLSGAVEDDCGKEVTERGFLWCEGAVEVLDVSRDTKVKCGTGIGGFNYTLTGLRPNMTYSFSAYAMNAEGTAYGEVVRFTTGVALPVHGKPVVDDITPFTVVLEANVLSDGGESASEQGFYWGENTNVENKVKCAGSTFSYQLNGLSRNTTYYVKSYSVNSVGTAYSDVIEFKTMPELPVVSSGEVSEIAEFSAVCTGSITDDGGAEITDKGFVYNLTSNPEAETGIKVSAGRGIDQFSSTLSELSPNKTYYVRAYAENSAGLSYGDERAFTTNTALPSVGTATLVTSTSSSLTVSASILDDGGETPIEVGFYYSTSADSNQNEGIKVLGMLSGRLIEAEITGLTRATTYYVRAYVVNSVGESSGNLNCFTTLVELPVVETGVVIDITDNSAVCGGNVIDDGGAEITASGLVWSKSPNPTIESGIKNNVGNIGSFSEIMTGLFPGTTYYVRAYATNSMGTSYGDELSFITTGDPLDFMDAANCFIISHTGAYAFKAVKGNSSESVGTVKSVSVLWESFGTSTAPKVGDLIKTVSYIDGYVTFTTTDAFKEGNAVIAAESASGTILWSWHIWMTDQPTECEYANYAGTMMDRNLGATSATQGDVGALGLLYQWGRKDPFLGSSSITLDVVAKSTISWPSPVTSSWVCGTMAYAIEHPTTFITNDGNNGNWCYNDSYLIDNTLWQSKKTIYDPCPAGWHVPRGASDGVWAKAEFNDKAYNLVNGGILFATNISYPATWYPAAGYRYGDNGSLSSVGHGGQYWSSSTSSFDAFCLEFYGRGYVDVDYKRDSAYGNSVRCIKE